MYKFIEYYNHSIITKTFDNYFLAKYYQGLYNSFPFHVKSKIPIHYNHIKYKYIPGEERYNMIHTSYDTNLELCRFLGHILGCFHFKHCIIADGYENICNQRNYIGDKCYFIPSHKYTGFIHGDLHLKNIIVHNGNMFFIDRLKEKGDILFDFPFIMSFLCIFIEKRNTIYLDYIKTFFSTYCKHLKGSQQDFFVSFRNNFINYGIVCYNIYSERHVFPEWRYGKIITNMLINENNFLDFINKLECSI